MKAKREPVPERVIGCAPPWDVPQQPAMSESALLTPTTASQQQLLSVRVNNGMEATPLKGSISPPASARKVLSNLANTHAISKLLGSLAEPPLRVEKEVSPVSVTGFVDGVETIKESLRLLEMNDLDSDEDLSCDSTIATDSESDSSTEASDTRRVCFQVDQDDNIVELVTEKSYANYELTPDLVANCWYNKKQRREFKAEVYATCREIGNPEYRRAALRMCTLAADPEYSQLLARDQHSRRSVDHLSNPDYRGIERPMFQVLMLPRKAAKSHVLALLQVQQIMRSKLRDRDCNRDEMERVMAETYRRRAQYATRFAILLAQPKGQMKTSFVADDNRR